MVDEKAKDEVWAVRKTLHEVQEENSTVIAVGIGKIGMKTYVKETSETVEKMEVINGTTDIVGRAEKVGQKAVEEDVGAVDDVIEDTAIYDKRNVTEI